MAPPPRELVSDVISEILLRLPPDEPECLFRAALVCKPWLRAIADPAFRSRYRTFHGTPPLLGLMDGDHKLNRGWSFRLVPTRAAAPALPLPWPDARRGLPLDCRHGRLLTIDSAEDRCSRFLVCDPVTGKGDHHRLPHPGIKIAEMTGTSTAQAVFCAAPGCNHLDCYGGPFCVVLMGKDFSARSTILATVYSSETGAWSVPAVLEGIRYEASGYGALIGDEIYFMLSKMTAITKYDWVKNCLSLIDPPPSAVFEDEVTLMVMEDSSLGLAGIEHSNLYLWSRKVSVEGTAEWVQCRVIDLDTAMPMANPSDEAYVVGFAEGVGVIFVSTGVGLFMMELKSEKVRKVHQPNPFLSVLPYMGFYTPDCSRLLRSEDLCHFGVRSCRIDDPSS